MNKKICYAVGAGYFSPNGFNPSDGDLVVAADGGYVHLKNIGIKPDTVIGDFDSAAAPNGENVVRLNPVKDETDMLEAVRIGMARGYTQFHIYGGTGGRSDHTMANIQLLNMLARQGMRGYLFGESEIMTAVRDGELRFDKSSTGYVSVFAMTTECRGVCESGLMYELDNYTMTIENPIGVSNEFVGVESRISVGDGTLLIIYPYTAKLAE